MPDLIHGILLAWTFVKLIGAVEDQTGFATYVLIGMHYSRRDDHQHRLVDAHHAAPEMAIGLRRRSIVPEVELEVGRADEAEAIGLIDVLVRAASHSGLGHRCVGHHRMVLCRQLVVAKELAEPAAGVVELLEW